MNRREFSVGAACVLAATALGGLPASVLAQARKPEEGTDYLALDKRVSVDAPAGKVEVIEFFWYSCPHCNAFEPKLDAWSKKLPADVVLKRVPVAFRDDFVPQQRLFYTLEALGKLGELHAKVFQAIHAERQAINREELILDWAAKQGLDRAKFKELYNSFSVSTKARRATQLQDGFKVQGVPAIGIAGRYLTDGTMAGTLDRALQVTDYLIAESRKSR
ncbi:MAG TPA: thiol:disulfide interchange protein DsbA/DsbL [Ramlibacter sp.]|nr:thiol:disulfide interchange protein DsbA/DsbL [Ramlibacter sp.]